MPEPLGALPRVFLNALGLGASPWAPGTVASIATAALIYAVAATPGADGLVACLGLGVYGSLATLAWGGVPQTEAGKGDPGWVVADEVAGQALASIPAVLSGSLAAHALALLLFRVFDILKPPPVRQAEGLAGGVGVLADDLVAGVLAGALVAGAWQLGLLEHLA